MSSDSGSAHRTRLLPILTAIVCAVIAFYVASMAPVWKLADGNRRRPVRTFYEPVVWLMEQTPLRRPLLAWCGAWGCRAGVEKHLRNRELAPLMDPMMQLQIRVE
jgi:hypothetical protein